MKVHGLLLIRGASSSIHNSEARISIESTDMIYVTLGCDDELLMDICVLQRSWSRGSCSAPQFPRCWTFGIAGWQQQHPNIKGDLLFDWVLWDWDFFLGVLLECLGIGGGTVCENMAALAVWFSLPNRFQIDLLKQERGKVRLNKDQAQNATLIPLCMCMNRCRFHNKYNGRGRIETNSLFS